MGRSHLIQETDKFLQLYTIEVACDFFVLSAVKEPIKSGLELLGGLGNPIQAAELMGDGWRVSGPLVQIHRGESQGEWNGI